MLKMNYSDLKDIKLSVLAEKMEKEKKSNDKIRECKERIKFAQEGLIIKNLKKYTKEIEVCNRIIKKELEYLERIKLYFYYNYINKLASINEFRFKDSFRFLKVLDPEKYINTIIQELEEQYRYEKKWTDYYYCEVCDKKYKGREAFINCMCSKNSEFNEIITEDVFEEWQVGSEQRAKDILVEIEILKDIILNYKKLIKIECSLEEVHKKLDEIQIERPSLKKIEENKLEENLINDILKLEKESLNQNFSKYTKLHFLYQGLASFYYGLGEEFYMKSLNYCYKDFDKLEFLDNEEKNYNLKRKINKLNTNSTRDFEIFSGKLITAEIALKIFKHQKEFYKGIELCNFLIKNKRIKYKKQLEYFNKCLLQRGN